jgi:predicted nucleotidyltransferase
MVSLATSSGSRPVDDALRNAIGIFETAFPGRIRAYYVEGSYADRSAVATSDIDLAIVFKDHFVDRDEADRAR